MRGRIAQDPLGGFYLRSSRREHGFRPLFVSVWNRYLVCIPLWVPVKCIGTPHVRLPCRFSPLCTGGPGLQASRIVHPPSRK